MKMFNMLARTALLVSALVGTTAYADALVMTDPTQLGRLSRNAIPQDWSHFELNPATNGEQFPGIINTTIPYHYHAYYFNVGMTPFVEVTIDSTAATTFFSAYQTFYNPGNLAQDWLGDAGTSGNSFGGTDPLTFQVVAGINTTLVIIVNETTTNGGVGLPFTLSATGSTDSMYDGEVDLIAVPAAALRIPEPSTLLLLAPLALVVGLKSRRRRAAVAA